MKQPSSLISNSNPNQSKKLGICIVYVADENFAWMIELQLRAFETFTRGSDFTLFAALPRAASRIRELLEARPFVKIVDTAPTPARKAAEHAHHMEQLVEHAKRAGCSHIAIFDSDSFPVHAAWFEKMCSLLSGKTPLVAVSRTEMGDFGLPHPCGMLFTTDFHDRLQPQFLPPKTRREALYRRIHRITRDTGVGYAYAVKRARLDWIELTMTARPPGNIFCATVYGDLIFHFGGGARVRAVLKRHERLIAYLYSRMKWFPPLAREFNKFQSRRDRICIEERARTERVLREDPDRFLSDLLNRPVLLDRQE